MLNLLLKFYYYTISKWRKFFKKLHYTWHAIKYLKSIKWGLRYRDEDIKNRAQDIMWYYTWEMFEKLKKWLQEKDQAFITRMLNKIKTISENNILPYKELFSHTEEQEQKAFAKFCLQYPNKYFSFNEITSRLNLFYKKTLHEIPWAMEYVKNKNILDCWWYIGDTALVFSKTFEYDKIYTFEPDTKNYQRAKKTIKDNNLNDKIIPIKLGLSWSEYNGKITGFSAGSKIEKSWAWEDISVTTIDNFVKKENIHVWLIKRDIEGMEYESILWAEKTIKEQKPILLISIYHTGKDFFEIKPLLESRNIWYKFMFLKWNCFHPFADILLVCY